jgi:two-component system, OmpR family, sensor histidine kinase KdpD
MDLNRIVSAGRGYPLAVVAVAAAAAVLLPFRAILAPSTVMLLFVPVIIGVARASGIRVSTLSAVLSFLVLDLVFVPPYYHLAVATAEQWIGLVVYLLVALVAGQQTGRLRSREQAAVERQQELELLNSLAFRLAAEQSAGSTAAFITARVVDVIGASRVAIYTVPEGLEAPQLLASAGTGVATADEAAVVDWVLREGKAIAPSLATAVPAGQRPVSVSARDAVPGLAAPGMYLPLQTASGVEGVLVAVLPEGRTPSVEELRLISAVASLAAASLERRRLEAEASHAEALREADRLKTTLVSSVSHELKTPLAAATARVTGLIEERGGDPARVVDELTEVADDLSRLDGSIADLLDLSRLEAAAWEPRLERYEVAEILGTVRTRLPASRRSRVRFSIDPGTPEVTVDFAQVVRAVVNLVENALAYSAEDAPVLVAARAEGTYAAIAVEDHGPGVSPAEKPRVFEKFYRGAAAGRAPGGTGLGLPIAAEVAHTHNGSVRVEDVEPHGARFVLTLPASRKEDVT